MHVFRSNIVRWPVAAALLAGTVLWLVVPQAFAASTDDGRSGWMSQFVASAQSIEVEHGLQDASGVGSLIVQPVVVPVTVTVPSRAAFFRTVPAERTDGVSIPRVMMDAEGRDASVCRYLGSSLQPTGP